jgi:hypothetical protein
MFVAGARGRVEGERVRTMDAGRFELPLRLREAAPPYTLEVHVQQGNRRIGARAPLPELFPGRRLELGDVRIDELPRLVHGVVIDDRSAPVPGATIELQAFRSEAPPRGDWRADTYVQARADAQGRYELYGMPRPLRLRLHATAPGHTPAIAEFSAGEARNLVLERLGALRGDGFVPAGIRGGALRLQLTQAGRSVRDEDLRARQDGAFRFRFDRLPRGSYDVTIAVRGVPRPLLRVPSVEVPPGAEAADPRLLGINLRGSVFQYVVRAVDEGGRPIGDPGSPLLATLSDAAGLPQTIAFPWRGDRAEFLATEPSVAVVALGAGRQPSRAIVHPGETRLTLRRLHPVEVLLPGLRALIGPDRQVRVSLVFAGDTGLPMTNLRSIDQASGNERGYERAALGKAGGAPLSPDDRARIALMLNGRYEVVVRLSGDGGAVSRPIGHVEVVLDGPAPQTVQVAIPAPVIRDAIAELGLRARQPRGPRPR